MKAKKLVAVLLVVGMVSVAGAALAGDSGRRPRGGPEPEGPRPMPWAQMAPCGCRPGGFGPVPGPGPRNFFNDRNNDRRPDGRGPGGPEGAFRPGAPNEKNWGPRERFAPDMPKEVRAKAVEAAKLRIDLDEVLSQKPLDRAKAIEIQGQIAKLELEIDAWRFTKKLDRIEEMQKQRDQKPDAKGPAPEKAPEKPAA